MLVAPGVRRPHHGPVRATGGRRTSELVHAVLARRHRVPAAGMPVTWASAVDRFARGVHRYHDRVEVVPDRALRRDLQVVGTALDRALAAARASGPPRDGRVPDGGSVRDLLRVGALCSHAIEAAVAAATARRAGDDDAVAGAVATAAALAAEIGGIVDPV